MEFLVQQRDPLSGFHEHEMTENQMSGFLMGRGKQDAFTVQEFIDDVHEGKVRARTFPYPTFYGEGTLTIKRGRLLA
jgi:hypothetical protein